MKGLFFLLLFSAFLSLPAGLKRWTRSFHPSRCTPPQIKEEKGEIFSSQSSEEIAQILSRPFHYLSRGAQSFVFASEDGNYVLKLFFFDLPRSKKQAVEKAKALFSSCRSAALAAQETALIYLHFGPSDEHLPKIHLQGPAWKKTSLSSEQYCFALQKRAVPLKQALSFACQQRERQTFRKEVDALFFLLQRRIAKGIRNSDRSLFDNFGFTKEGEAIEIDFGHYRFDPAWKEEDRLREIDRYRDRLVTWTSIKMPEWKEEILCR